MLTRENIQNLSKQFQTNERNIVREYIQHLFLANLYKIKESQNLLFKGGTSLRFLYQSPRFSEDLDFTGQDIYRLQQIDELFLHSLSEIEKVGIKINFKEAKSTRGGYLGIIYYELFNLTEDMKFEVSLRKTKKKMSEVTTVISDFTLPYTLIHLAPEELIDEKIKALIERRKPRDYYDLYFLLRHPQLNKFVKKNLLNKVLNNLIKEQIDFRRELSALLPVSHHAILKDFKDILKREIGRYL